VFITGDVMALKLTLKGGGGLDVISWSWSSCRLHLQSSKHTTCADALNKSRSPDLSHQVTKELLWRHQPAAAGKHSYHKVK
jgi:hypothetical protein